ncbi:MAG TPA: aconitate hydratase AcnA, partial [Longimicrobium sp.]|nr:aconitate hydratase AcnA [Longimicrobium sp.]
MTDSFGSRGTLRVGDREYQIFRLDALNGDGRDISRLPYSLRILLENLLRTEDGVTVTRDDIEALAGWNPKNPPDREIAFSPARTVLQDFTGVPAIVDLAAMRDAMAKLGGDPSKINPLTPVELVVDHSIQVDAFGTKMAFEQNVELDYERNAERYAFLRWGQQAFNNFQVVPPNTGIIHQVNLEYLSRVVFSTDESPNRKKGELPLAYPDTCVGTDSHTPMVNGLGVLAWGVGGIEAEAAMLGQPISMLIPEVVGFHLEGELPEGATATDLVLTITEMLRKHGVVGKFVEFYGPGVSALPLANRATIGNMSPEFGSTIAVFPIDEQTIDYLRLTGRPAEQLALVETYAKEQGLWHDPDAEPRYSERLELDVSTVVPSLAGPKRPQDRVSLSDAKQAFRTSLADYVSDGTTGGDDRKPGVPQQEQPKGVQSKVDEASAESFPSSDAPASNGGAGGGNGNGAPDDWHDHAAAASGGRPTNPVTVTLEDGTEFEVDHGAVAIAAITSCTNTSNPSVMIGAALLAKNAVEKGLSRKPWVKTTLAPGSKVV